jgi:hypothetical protein
MSKFTFWADLFKFSDDILDVDYVYDKNYSVKVKAKSSDSTGDYAAKFEQSKPDASGNSKNAIELKQKLNIGKCDIETKIKSGGKISSEAEFKACHIDEAFKGWSYLLTSNFVNGGTLDKSSFLSAVKFKQSNFEGKASFTHDNWSDVDIEASFQPEEESHLIVGGSATLGVTTTSVKKYQVGVINRLDKNFSYGIKNWSDDMKHFGNFSVHTLNQVNDQVSIASKIGYSLDTKDLDATAGFSVSCPKGEWTWKSKFTSDGIWGNSFKHQLNRNLFVVFSSALNTGSKSLEFSSPQPFGIGLEAKF